jgi:hypothetical protein
MAPLGSIESEDLLSIRAKTPSRDAPRLARGFFIERYDFGSRLLAPPALGECCHCGLACYRPAAQIRCRHGKLSLQQIDANDRRQDHHLRPKSDGAYIVEFKTAAGETLAISVPSAETAVLRHFQARMPYGLVVPEADRPPDDG